MPNNIPLEIPPLFHIHYNWSSNLSPAPSRTSVIWLAKKFSHSQEELMPQENKLASCSSPEKLEQAQATSEFPSNLELLTQIATAQPTVKQTNSKIRYRAFSGDLFRPYLNVINTPPVRKKIQNPILNSQLAGNNSTNTRESDEIISPVMTTPFTPKQKDMINIFLRRVTQPYSLRHINDINKFKKIEDFQQQWSKKINMEFYKNKLKASPLNNEGVWMAIIHQLSDSHKGIAPELIAANMIPCDKKNDYIQTLIPSFEELVRERLEQYLQLDLRLVLSGVKLDHR